jgi:hypothetical protein
VLGGVLLALGSMVAAIVAVAGVRASRLMNSAVIDAIVAMPTNAEKIATKVGDSSRGALGVNGAEGARPEGGPGAKSWASSTTVVGPRPMASSSSSRLVEPSDLASSAARALASSRSRTSAPRPADSGCDGASAGGSSPSVGPSAPSVELTAGASPGLGFSSTSGSVSPSSRTSGSTTRPA